MCNVPATGNDVAADDEDAAAAAGGAGDAAGDDDDDDGGGGSGDETSPVVVVSIAVAPGVPIVVAGAAAAAGVGGECDGDAVDVGGDHLCTAERLIVAEKRTVRKSHPNLIQHRNIRITGAALIMEPVHCASSDFSPCICPCRSRSSCPRCRSSC